MTTTGATTTTAKAKQPLSSLGFRHGGASLFEFPCISGGSGRVWCVYNWVLLFVKRQREGRGGNLVNQSVVD